MKRWMLVAALAAGCGGPQTTATTATTADKPDESAPDDASDVAIKPEKAGPPKLTDAEKKELGGLCNPIEPDIYEAHKAALAFLEAALDKDMGDPNAEKNALAEGVKKLGGPKEGMGATDHERCVALFKKSAARKLHEYEPGEKEARDFVTSCMKRVDATFGKQKMAFGDATVQQGPFCPDDLPVPPRLSQLPYKSTPEDWATPTWKCLVFGMRTVQRVQVEYVAPRTAGEFTCIARFVPRQGGAPIEIFRGGKINEEGELMVQPKAKARRMKK